MPLPFLKPKKVAGLIVAQRLPDGGKKELHEEDQGLKACSADLIRAVHAKDEDGVAAAIRAAFEILDAQPHVEGEHTNEE